MLRVLLQSDADGERVQRTGNDRASALHAAFRPGYVYVLRSVCIVLSDGGDHGRHAEQGSAARTASLCGLRPVPGGMPTIGLYPDAGGSRVPNALPQLVLDAAAEHAVDLEDVVESLAFTIARGNGGAP